MIGGDCIAKWPSLDLTRVVSTSSMLARLSKRKPMKQFGNTVMGMLK